MRLLRSLNRFLRDDSGQDLLEYALVLASIAAAAILGSNTLASTINTAIVTITGAIGSTVNSI